MIFKKNSKLIFFFIIQRDQSPPKIQKLVVHEEREEDKYDTITVVKDLEFPSQEIDLSTANLKKVVDGVLHSISASQKQEALEWRPEVNVCPHTLDLKQGPEIKVAMGSCSQCELEQNLWLCLECGALNCGRNQLGGAPGNSHGLAHYDSSKHPVAVKLGSITPDGTADVYCYACDDEVKDFHLAAHLKHFGINIAEAEKTEKSLTELQLEQNIKWDFSLTSKNGEQLIPVFGPGLTGLKNLGNSCYMASVLQCLFSLEPFQKAYYKPDELQKIIDNPEDDLQTQLVKIADGLLSGRYSAPDKTTVRKRDAESGSLIEDEYPHQRGLPPAIFKQLIGKGHPEFSTMKQQDAFEFLTHFLGKIQEYSKKHNEAGVSDPTEMFNFKTEQRLECTKCHKVRYNSTLQQALSLRVPARKIPDEEGKEDIQENKGQDDNKEEKYENVEITELFDSLTSEEEVDYVCKQCKNNTSIKKTGFETFPDALIVNALRFKVIDWVPTKLDIPVSVAGDKLDLDKYIVSAHNPDEDLAMDDEDEEEEGGATFIPDPEAFGFLSSMGYPDVHVEKALYHNNNQMEPAVEWLLAHMEDPDIDVPLDLSGGNSKKKQGPLVNPDQVNEICGMGFSPNLVRKALRLHNNSTEAAVDWIFGNMEDIGETEEEQAAMQEASEESENTKKDVYCGNSTLPANYKLKAIVCHKGRSSHAGHYVAFIKKNVPNQGPGKPDNIEGEQWILFNDEKVVASGEVEEMKKFAYIYIFVRE